MRRIFSYQQFIFESQTEKIYTFKGDPYDYKVINGEWWTIGVRSSEARSKVPDWKSLASNALATGILDKRQPGVRKGAEVKPDDKTTNNIDATKTDTTTTKSNVEKEFTPVTETDEKKLKKEFNFHLIPDGKNNYRSAQLPVDILLYVIKKYGIKTIIRFNGDGNDGRHTKNHPITNREDEKTTAKQVGVEFNNLSSTRHQDKVNDLLSRGNVLVHCAHGADRTGGNVGGYLHTVLKWPTDKVWAYTTQYNGWNKMCVNAPNSFENGGYLKQAQKFGVKDLKHAQELSAKKLNFSDFK